MGVWSGAKLPNLVVRATEGTGGRGVCPQDNDSMEGSVPGSWEKQTSHGIREGCRLVRVPTEVLPPCREG